MFGKIFLFGTGIISNRYTKLLAQMSIEVFGYIDNDSLKWGDFFWQKKIYAPEILDRIEDFVVVIACSDIIGVTAQLSQMGMKNRIITLEHIIRKQIQKLEFTEIQKDVGITEISNKEKIIIDNLDGAWGGSEDWAHKVTFLLSQRGYNTILIENTDSSSDEKLKNCTIRIDKKKKNIYETYRNLVGILLRNKPFVLFNMWGTEVLWAASYVKKLYPEEVCIISNIVSDNVMVYQRHYEWDDCIDLYLCISSMISNNLKELYKVSEKKIYYKAPFVEHVNSSEKEYNVDIHIPLKIGYPCRLVCAQKRADLLPELIKKLEEKRIKYELNIAGDGECEKEIEKFVKENNLDKKVRLYGRLSRDGLIHFLENQDIYLNFSEFEGTSLTMLEAMASGCVPVVTDVSGVSDFIENKKNGMVSSVGDLESIAENISFLDQNRNKVEVFGRRCVAIVHHKCDLNNYISYIEKLINLKTYN